MMSVYNNSGLPGCYGGAETGGIPGSYLSQSACSTEREREIASQLSAVARAADYTAELVTQLAARLAPVLRPPQPTKVNGDGPPVSTELGGALYARSQRIGATNETLLEILDRLEI